MTHLEPCVCVKRFHWWRTFFEGNMRQRIFQTVQLAVCHLLLLFGASAPNKRNRLQWYREDFASHCMHHRLTQCTNQEQCRMCCVPDYDDIMAQLILAQHVLQDVPDEGNKENQAQLVTAYPCRNCCHIIFALVLQNTGETRLNKSTLQKSLRPQYHTIFIPQFRELSTPILPQNYFHPHIFCKCPGGS